MRSDNPIRFEEIENLLTDVIFINRGMCTGTGRTHCRIATSNSRDVPENAAHARQLGLSTSAKFAGWRCFEGKTAQELSPLGEVAHPFL